MNPRRGQCSVSVLLEGQRGKARNCVLASLWAGGAKWLLMNHEALEKNQNNWKKKLASASRRAWTTTLSVIKGLTDLLERLVELLERLLVLAVGSGLFVLGYLFIRRTITQREMELLEWLSENWKILLILLLVPLFYRTVRIFLEEVREFWGMKRAQTGEVEGEDEKREQKESRK
jgi:hypothetical protein